MLNEIQYSYHNSDRSGVWDLIQKHMASLSYPMDYFSEQQLLESQFYLFTSEGKPIGYSAIKDGRMTGFFIEQLYYHSAGYVLEDFLDAMGTDVVKFLTQDTLLGTLISDWDFDILGYGYYVLINFFQDQEALAEDMGRLRFAQVAQAPELCEMTNGYFNNEKLENACLYALAEDSETVGYGLIKKSLVKDVGFIDFYLKKPFRDGDYGRRIVTALKSKACAMGLQPVGSCDLRNTLTRKEFEASNMAAVGKSGLVRLIERRRLPLQFAWGEGQLY